ncbi:MAG: GNAT family N-acetyltransferase [Betaproteobacteria bacterium]|nr:GNAT family N-acetyltransferase [Betaproteobacteria bacterium]
MPPVIEVVSVQSADQLESIRRLFREYSELVSAALCFQGFDAELAGLPGHYAPPDGLLLLARGAEGDAGCVAMKRLDARSAEMKRLFVRSAYRGTGLGRRLARRIVDEARRAGCSRLVLDTMPHLTEAITLYRSLSFRDCPPYLAEPTPGALCLELSLS